MMVVTYPDALRLHVVHPATTEEAQSSIAWPAAALLVDGEVATEQVADARTGDARLHELADKVGFIASDKLQGLHVLSATGRPGGMDAARLTVELTDGRMLESGLVGHLVSEREAALWGRERLVHDAPSGRA
jgi:2-methylcitrate dehydratase PrpD